MTLDNQTFELENIDTLIFKNGDEIYLDHRNNAPILLEDNIDLGNGFYEDGLGRVQVHTERQAINLHNNILQNNIYDVEGNKVKVSGIAGDRVDTYLYDGLFHSTLNHNGNLVVNYTIMDDVSKEASSGFAQLTLMAQNDKPYMNFIFQGYQSNTGGYKHYYDLFYSVHDVDQESASITVLWGSTARYFENGETRDSYWKTNLAYGTRTVYVTDDENGETAYFFTYNANEKVATLDPAITPIVIDLNADGFEWTQAAFDVDSDGRFENTKWASEADAFLAVDYDSDGVITHGMEIAFSEWHADATTDLEGLQLAFDTNRDGVLNAKDAMWSSFGVWQDRNSNGITDAGEFLNMEAMGIVAFHLESDGIEQSGEGYHIFGQGQFEYTDGTFGDFADTALAYTEIPTDEDEQQQVDEDDVAVTAAEQAENSSQEEKEFFADEDDAIFAQMLQMEQWQQQSAGAALSEGEPAIIEQQSEAEEFSEVM